MKFESRKTWGEKTPKAYLVQGQTVKYLMVDTGDGFLSTFIHWGQP